MFFCEFLLVDRELAVRPSFAVPGHSPRDRGAALSSPGWAACSRADSSPSAPTTFASDAGIHDNTETPGRMKYRLFGFEFTIF